MSKGNKFTEYIKLIPKGIKNAENIAEGMVNLVKENYKMLSPKKQAEITRRRLICAYCPFMSDNALTSPEYKDVMGQSYVPKFQGQHCTLCGCFIKAKTASLNSDCGASYWNSIQEGAEKPKELVEVKWLKFEE